MGYTPKFLIDNVSNCHVERLQYSEKVEE